MPKYWSKPIYEFTSNSGGKIIIDVTTSVSPGLPPSQVVTDRLIPFLEKKMVKTVLDFGAGALRHTKPLLDAGFQVCAVEFEECYSRPKSQEMRNQLERHPNFSSLIWPKQFIKNRRKFDAALLIYVLQIMPILE